MRCATLLVMFVCCKEADPLPATSLRLCQWQTRVQVLGRCDMKMKCIAHPHAVPVRVHRINLMFNGQLGCLEGKASLNCS